jgi:hypothetical protein
LVKLFVISQHCQEACSSNRILCISHPKPSELLLCVVDALLYLFFYDSTAAAVRDSRSFYSSQEKKAVVPLLRRCEQIAVLQLPAAGALYWFMAHRIRVGIIPPPPPPPLYGADTLFCCTTSLLVKPNLNPNRFCSCPDGSANERTRCNQNAMISMRAHSASGCFEEAVERVARWTEAT